MLHFLLSQTLYTKLSFGSLPDQCRHFFGTVGSTVNADIAVQCCILESGDISLMINLSCLIYLRDRLYCFLLRHAKALGAVLQAHIIWSININLQQPLFIPQTVTATSPYDNTGFLLSEVLDDTLLYLEQRVSKLERVRERKKSKGTISALEVC